MQEKHPDPVALADDTARQLARQLIAAARHGSLATFGASDYPGISLVALAPSAPGFLTLMSGLAAHHGALRANPKAALMLGEPGKGDPLAHPRLMIDVTARFLPKDAATRAAYLAHQPKAALYIDFADFDLVHLIPESALLNGGFGRAWRLTSADL
ncbi:HugZ family pyridoxamine 5'-phosphate oxidase [Neogemmobacter tilapiae]|uniref:Pyridoxamine 5'-phosphate oxidase n=1 Tax=Neogemmobacter tilapiae TaxID=875041 RepID=A0A918TKX5_9RHOB|nr:pyridoxamine 5'-phosphate oxidase family protein [Gemmobacter tilapiae]GHC53806.1 pyridoxamine 5'-phosphate oxidase [Gemmobacter tilapiae]